AIPSLTGTVASSRLPCDQSRLALLVQAFGSHFEVPGFVTPQLNAQEQRWADRAVEELRAHAGRSLLTIGPHLDPRWQALAPVISQNVNRTGRTAWDSQPSQTIGDETQSLTALAADMAAGAVETLVMVACNPVYAAPGALEFSNKLARVTNRIHVGELVD